MPFRRPRGLELKGVSEMGVEFFPCESCGKSVCDCGPYTNCVGCLRQFCTDCHEGPGLEDDDFDDEGNPLDQEEYKEKVRACPVCSLRVVPDDDLLYYLLDKLGMSRKVAEEGYRKSRKSR